MKPHLEKHRTFRCFYNSRSTNRFTTYRQTHHSRKPRNNLDTLWVSANTGDAMCYLILTDKNTILVRSVVRSALQHGETNARQPIPDSSREGSFTDTVELKAAHEDKRESQETEYILPTFAINDAIGFTFVRDFKNVPTKATVKEYYDEETNRILLEYSHGAEEWIAPNIVEEAMQSNNGDGTKVWT